MSLGYIPDVVDSRDHLFGTGVLEQGPGDLRHLIRSVFNQGPTNSCVANAICSGIAMRRVARGLSWAPPSRIFAYRSAVLSLGEYGRLPDGKLADAGCRPRDAMRGLAKAGAPNEDEWPFSRAQLQVAPPWSVRRRAIDLGFRYYRCNGLEDIRLALSLGYPVTAGFQVDQAFRSSHGPALIEDFDASDIAGGHMMLLVAEGPERDRFTLLNSYGAGYRSGGFVDISPALAGKATDTWAIL